MNGPDNFDRPPCHRPPPLARSAFAWWLAIGVGAGLVYLVDLIF